MLIQKKRKTGTMFKKGWLAIPSVAAAVLISTYLTQTGRAFEPGFNVLTGVCIGWIAFVAMANIWR